MKIFENYLVQVGIRLIDFTHPFETVCDNIDYFRDCHKRGLSAYKALTLFHFYLEEKK